MTGIDRLRERIAGLRALNVQALSDGAAIWLAALEHAEQLVAPDYTEADDDEADDDEADEDEADDEAEPAEPELPSPADEPERARRKLGATWTPAREALLRERWPTTFQADREALRTELNALPGFAVMSVEAMRTHARKIGVAVSDTVRVDAWRMKTAAARAARWNFPTPPAEVDAEDLAEAHAMLAAGKNGRDLADYFGWTLERAGDVAQAWRAAQRSG